MVKRISCALLALLLLTACSKAPQPPVVTTGKPAAGPVSPVDTQLQPEPTQLESEPEVEPLQIPRGSIAQTPGMVGFYVGSREFYCGQPVAGLLKAPVHIHGDVEALVQPGNYSDEVRLRFPDASGEYNKTLYFVAVNPTEEPLAVRDCLIFSLAINCESGHTFGIDKASFVTGEATYQQLTNAWGEPTSLKTSQGADEQPGENFRDVVYYRPFSYLQIVLRQGVVEQVRAYHNAYLYPELSQQPAPGESVEGDSLLQLSQHMDITPYLNGGKVGSTPLEMVLTIDGKEIKMGVHTYELPDPWGTRYSKTASLLNSLRCVYCQFPNEEGFIFGNATSDILNTFANAQIKGVYAFNPEYVNWATDQTGCYGFSYAGFTHTSTIEDVIAALGQPYEVIAESGTNWCFAWLHYQADNGDTLRLKVDPETNQLIELRMEQNSRFYYYP